MNSAPPHSLPARAEITELVAVLVAVSGGQPRVLTARIHPQLANLPCGPFQTAHRSLQAGMRTWVEPHIHNTLGYVEQLYTFADGDRANWQGQRIISVSYLGLTREQDTQPAHGVVWHDWYRHFPWEDWRDGPPPSLETLQSALQDWAKAAGRQTRLARRQRLEYLFPEDRSQWNADLILQRYELLYETGLVHEARRGIDPQHERTSGATNGPIDRCNAAQADPAREADNTTSQPMGEPMLHDHRRILATGIARLRAKIRYRPVIFELLPPAFTLLQLQQTFEALTGQRLHKQNFRRLITQQALVEETGAMTRGQAGRPAKLFQFRAQIMRERAFSGSKLPMAR